MTDAPRLRGWAALKANNPERFAELTSRGGKKSSTNFKNDPELARIAGRKGGKISRRGSK